MNEQEQTSPEVITAELVGGDVVVTIVGFESAVSINEVVGAELTPPVSGEVFSEPVTLTGPAATTDIIAFPLSPELAVFGDQQLILAPADEPIEEVRTAPTVTKLHRGSVVSRANQIELRLAA